MPNSSAAALLVTVVLLPLARAQGTVPTFQRHMGDASFTLAGRDPSQGGVTTIGTLLVPVTLSFESRQLDAAPDTEGVLGSPVFSNFPFPSGGRTQYADAMLRSIFPKQEGWHTILSRPDVKRIRIEVPAHAGYVLVSHKTGRALGIVDVEFLQKALFARIPKQEGKLVIAVTHNTAFYALGDATVCCSWGTHGVDSATGNSFVLGSYLRDAPAIVEDEDVQPLTQQLAELIKDPLHDPLVRGRGQSAGNIVAAWTRPLRSGPSDESICGGTGVASTYFLLDPADTNRKNNLPASKSFSVRTNGAAWHVQNAALPAWYGAALDDSGSTLSFPDAGLFTTAARSCPARGARSGTAETASAAPAGERSNGHWLIGYWTGSGAAATRLRLRDVPPQWDVVIVAFATPGRNAPEGTMQFRPPGGYDAAQFKAEIADLKNRHRKVLLSLGGGGQYFTLADSGSIPNFVSSVAAIIAEYGFDGIDIDFETPSLALDAGDQDFRRPTTPSIVNLIAGLRRLRDRFGPDFMISLVPEGTQIPAGFAGYGGQFGSYLPIAYAIRDILSFIDVQDYNTPPLEGLDGEIYQAGSVDYHAAVTELLLRGFHTGTGSRPLFPPFPAHKVAVGFLPGDTNPDLVRQAMEYLITGKAPVGTTYKLGSHGYPGLIGAMFWTIDADRQSSYRFSNVIGPLLHSYRTAR